MSRKPQYAYTVNWDEPDEATPPRFLWSVVFVLAFAAFALLINGLLAGGFASAGATQMNRVLAEGRDLPGGMGGVYPLVPFLLSKLFAAAPRVAAAAPYYADALAAAVLLALGFQRLLAGGMSRVLAFALIVVLAANPLFLFAATGGSGIAVALFFAYLFALGILAWGRGCPLRGGVLIALAYLGVVLSTPLGFYFLLASLPFLLFASRQRMMAVMPQGFYLALFLVPAVVLGIVLAGEAVLSGDLATFLRGLTGNPQFGVSEPSLAPWPYMMGGAPIEVAGVVLAGIFLAFPVIVLALTGVFAGPNVLRAAVVLGGITVLTGAVTTYLGVLSHPAYLWVFVVPLILVVLEELRQGIGTRLLAVIALTAGIAGGWWLLGLHPTLYLTVWRAEMSETLAHMAHGFPGPAEAAPPSNH